MTVPPSVGRGHSASARTDAPDAPPRGDAAPFLQRVCAEARDRVDAARRVWGADRLRDAALATPAPPSFAAHLAADGLGVIAEIKRASPSRGRLAEIPDPRVLAASYADGGASAISVLTEPRHFLGSLDDLRAVAATVDLPVLRKDFVVDTYQLLEARAAGAAAALLIVAALDDELLTSLLSAADAVGLETLVEVHTAGEADRAAQAHAASGVGGRLVLGINARNLATLTVDLAVVEELAAARPADALLVAESGIHGPRDAARVAAVGADALLVGEHVATADDPAAAVAALRGVPVGAGVPTRPSTGS